MIINKTIQGLILTAVLSVSANAQATVILDDLIVSGTSDGTAPAYDCSPGATLPFFPLDSSSVTETIPAGDPRIVVEPIGVTCVPYTGTGESALLCEYTCTTAGSSACVGFDCDDGEMFDGDELLLQENNVRIRFHDTSLPSGLGESWNVEANAAFDFGQSYFGFQMKSVEPDLLLLSDGTALDYNCDDLGMTLYPLSNPPSIGTIPPGEPVIVVTPIIDSCINDGGQFVCLHMCEQQFVYEVQPVLTLGTAGTNPSFNDGVAIGYESATEDGVVSVGRDALLRRIAHVAAGIDAMDALTQEGLGGRLGLMTQQIADFNLQLDDIDAQIVDNCLEIANPDQLDTDGDGIGNLCDFDLNNDCIINFDDLDMFKQVFFTTDDDADFDNDGVVGLSDLALIRENFFGTPGPSGAPNICDNP